MACRALLEVVSILVRNTEQFADHQRRNRQCEALDEIDWRAGVLHRVEVLGHDLGDPRFQALLAKLL